MLTRTEFENLRLENASRMAETNLNEEAIALMQKADKYMWFHQTNFMGEPILNTAQDVLATQELIFKTRPKFIIEVGVAWAGMLLFYSTLMSVLGGEKIIAIDINIPEDLVDRINRHEELAKRIHWIKGSSHSENVISEVRQIVGDCTETLVHLDSNHSHDHVLKELLAYEAFVGKDYYMICGDTIIEKFPDTPHRERPWGPGNNPMTALHEFKKLNGCFESDLSIENKLLFSSHPEGYLIRVK